MKKNKFKMMKAVKTSEKKNKFKSNYNLKTHVILIYCDPLLLFSMVMDKYIYNNSHPVPMSHIWASKGEKNYRMEFSPWIC